jgi:FMN-dependent NADH-azoreductase
MKLLHIDSSILGTAIRSPASSPSALPRSGAPPTQAPQWTTWTWSADAPSHLSAQTPWASGCRPAPMFRRTCQRRLKTPCPKQLVSQFLAADVIVVGAPLYNFSIPSQLKAWIDRVAQAGRTFKYTDKGPVGLAGGKTVIVASTRGGVYSTSDAGNAMEHQESYLKTVFGFFGISDVRFVRAEGLAMGDAPKAQALAAAQAEILAHAGAAANEQKAVAAA